MVMVSPGIPSFLGVGYSNSSPIRESDSKEFTKKEAFELP
jgi:hypothetical protein